MQVGYFARRSKIEPLEKIVKPRGETWTHISGRDLPVTDIAEQFSLNPDIIRDIMDCHELPRLEIDNGINYLFIRTPIYSPENGKTVPLLMVMAPNLFLTISVDPHFNPLKVDQFLTNKVDNLSIFLPSVIAYTVYEFEVRIQQLAEKIANSRKRLAQREVKNADFIEFVEIEDSLNGYRGSLEGLLNVISQLETSSNKILTSYGCDAVNDIKLHVGQLLVSINSNISTMKSIHNAYSTIANNVLNQRMKTLTTITILLAIPNVFYGMYGMNIVLPIQHEPWAFIAIVGLTILLIILTYLIAKRKQLF